MPLADLTTERPLKKLGFVAALVAAAVVVAALAMDVRGVSTLGPSLADELAPEDLAPVAARAEIRRTAYGVPHVLADDLEAAYFALGYLQMEDYGERVLRGLIAARGSGGDFRAARSHARAEAVFDSLDADTRAAYAGFAGGVNYYALLHPDEFGIFVPRIRPEDALAREIVRGNAAEARRFVERLESGEGAGRRAGAVRDGASAETAASIVPASRGPAGADGGAPGPDAADLASPGTGSNAWALHPDRTTSGHAILLRNPHLSWDAGYYEAHMRVPGVVDFYGDFRIGGPFSVIGGFNRRLGWATTNNAPDLEEIYALRLDPERPDHVLLDGGSVPLTREDVTARMEVGSLFALSFEQTFWRSPFGDVIHRDDELAYVMKVAREWDYRMGQQFLRMMRASSLEEWRDAMRMQARVASNLTYADADGNIFYVWNAATPRLPHEPTRDDEATVVSTSSEMWQSIVAFDSLPQRLNPPGGYLHNENDPFHFANLLAPIDTAGLPGNYPPPRLRLRSQHSLQLISGDDLLSLEDVVRLKHSMRMLAADRLKDELLAAVDAAGSAGSIADAAAVLRAWDNTASRSATGAVLFEAWLRRYADGTDDVYREPWVFDRPVDTPAGLGDPAAALTALEAAAADVRDRYGRLDVPWGEVHRVRRGDVDVPVGGCPGGLGCFRVLNFEEAEDGKQVAASGDGWVLAVEFGHVPRAYSVLSYGESSRPHSPYHDDQAAMFADNRMKPVAFTEEDIAAQVVERYRPGEEGGRE